MGSPIAGVGEDAAAHGDLDITDDTLIDGRGATVDANGLDRVFDVRLGASVTLLDIGITGGSVSLEPGAGASGRLHERARQVCSRLELIDATVTNNGAIGGGGGVFVGPGMGGTSITRTTISRNVARGGGGVLADGLLTIADSAIHPDSASFLGRGHPGHRHLPDHEHQCHRQSRHRARCHRRRRLDELAASLLPADDRPERSHLQQRHNGRRRQRGARTAPAVVDCGGQRCRSRRQCSDHRLGRYEPAGEHRDAQPGGGSACAGTVTSSGRNITDGTDNGARGLGPPPNDGDMPNPDPHLEPWGDLKATSPVIDAAGLDRCAQVDIRGTDRPQGPACDIGAIERQSA